MPASNPKNIIFHLFHVGFFFERNEKNGNKVLMNIEFLKMSVCYLS